MMPAPQTGTPDEQLAAMFKAVRLGVAPMTSAMSLLAAIGYPVAISRTNTVPGLSEFSAPLDPAFVQDALFLVCDRYAKSKRGVPRLMSALLLALAQGAQWRVYLRTAQHPHAFVDAAYAALTATGELSWIRASTCNAMLEWLSPGADKLPHPGSMAALMDLNQRAVELSTILLRECFGEHWLLLVGTDEDGLIDPGEITRQRPTFMPGIMPPLPAIPLPALS